MKNAIVTGSTGLVGSAVARHLAKQGVKVLCLGRKELTESEIAAKFGFKNIDYAVVPMDRIQSLTDAMNRTHWVPSDSCVFYHFAWGGLKKLTDGDFRDQFVNAIHTAKAVSAAKQAGCTKFVCGGSLEETFAESYLAGGNRSSPYSSAQTDYAISKLAARDMSKIVAYLEKIDYIHTRLSVPLDASLTRGGYVSSTIRKILAGDSYQLPSNPNLFDIITTQDVAEAFFRIGQRGKNKADYFVGTSEPKTLREYFAICEQVRDGDFGGASNSVEDSAAGDLFSIQRLVDDTGFTPFFSYEKLVESLVRG